MATALQQQLAAIQQSSTQQLDLKAQKTRHSKSLLFEPRDAASQSFDTIYQLCYEGFEELCMLDARFSPFARNLFSEQSKNEDRTQMTAHENGELDRTIASFLGLVGGRLLLKPAMKAVEWLVRRFRVQEYNTEAVLLTFLPYHTSHIFPTLLSIVSEQLPASFRWLHPYVASVQSPPRHAVLSAAINNPGFFSAFSQYVLQVSRARQHAAILLGFWASITAQAVNGMIDSTRSGRDAIRKQREEDLLLRVLPILQSALSIKGVPELYLGSCMIMTILAAKASLEDKVLDAMMEAVVGAWTQPTLEDGLTCLAVMAEEKQHASQPKTVTRAILKADECPQLLKDMSQRHRVDKLTLGVIMGALDSAAAYPGLDGLDFAQRLVGLDILSAQHLCFLLETLLAKAEGLLSSADDPPDTEHVVVFLSSIASNAGVAGLLRQAVRNKSVDLHKISPDLATVLAQSHEETHHEQLEAPEPMQLDGNATETHGLGSLLEALPNLDDQHPSFLDPANDAAFKQYAAAFALAAASEKGLSRFIRRTPLHRSNWTETPTFLTLLVKLWSGSAQAITRARALEVTATELQLHSSKAPLDMQLLLPYVINALGDRVHRVRTAAASVCKALHSLYGVSGSKGKIDTSVGTWGDIGLYAAGTPEVNVLSITDVYKFLDSAVVPMLEDCVLDGAHAVRALRDALNGKDLKTTTRTDVCIWLAQNAAATPVLSVKLRLLDILRGVGKAANDTRKNVLLPLVTQWIALPSAQVLAACSAGGLSPKEVERAVIGSLSHRSADEVLALKQMASGEIHARDGIPTIAFERLRDLWSAMKEPSQTALVDFLLDLAVDGAAMDEMVQGEALDTLRNLHFPSEVLVHLVDGLPNASDLQDQPPSAKKQRTAKTESGAPRTVDSAQVNAAVRRITLALELVEGSKPEQHPQLLKGLFHLLGELHQYKTLLGSQLVYLQGLLMSCLLSIIKGLQSSRAENIDRSVIRADLIVECVRTTSSTQVHNTALLLISSLASWAPDLVLHSVMPLFTFMSTTLLRQSDEYSAHVTDQTVARIVPPLAASLKKRGKDLVSGAAELLLSFTAAFEHIPLHRRAGLFQHLVQTLGPEESLFAVVAMLVERYPTDTRVQPFIRDLMNSFPVSVQLRALNEYLDLINDGLKHKRTLSNVILGFAEKDAEQIEESVDTLLQALADVLQDSILRRRVAKEFAKGGTDAAALQTVYAQILDKTMQLTRDLAANDDLKDTADSMLTSLLGLTPTKDFIESSAQLMQTGSDATRQQVFHSLEARVVQAKRGDVALQQTFLEVLSSCCCFVQQSQPVATRHAAITCIDQIVEKYGKRDRAAVFDAAKAVAGDAALGSDDASLRIISVLCLASMVAVLEDGFIPILPQVLTKTLDYAEEAFTTPKNARQLQSACFSLAVAVLDHLPWMFAPQYLDRAFVIAGKSVVFPLTGEGGLMGLTQLCDLAARKVNTGELFAAVDRTWMVVGGLGPMAALQHLNIVRLAIQHHTKANVTKNAQTLFAILLNAFDLRRTTSDEEDDHTEVFALVDRIALDMTLKLNDATFRPFFIRLVEWATVGLPKKDARGRVLRATSLYSFAHTLFEQLKSIVTSYASFLLESAASLLSSLTATEADERALLDVLLRSLSRSFEHDQDDFWQAPAHFDAVATPLLSQLEKAKYLPVAARIIPAITDLAAAAASPEHHKAMNTTIMQYMRHQDAAVRLAAVKSERAITERLNFDWLALLPEMLPFISELQEDDDEEVERETLRWVRQIEEVTGESLEGMLQ
ncbi:hypothetical protein LTR36_003508 [Oleoguttula mirabilis]|uniref:U3 small nucleolar RNA-associated protein 10 n=1 Tax=Oleoguttula mirabilis TaxID=1507867 RepID=A0AAV9JJI7_9PEZI|nr:hypothetical protein LTR36_003508 [Oleoguttula mirabilis]